MLWSLSVMPGIPKGIKSVLVRLYIVALVYVETSVTLIYVWVSVRQELLRVLYPKEFVNLYKCGYFLARAYSDTTV